jgi:hypothetical protein
MLLSHPSDDLFAHLGLILFTHSPSARGFGYYNLVGVLGFEIKQGKLCLASNLIPSAQVQKDRRSVNLIHLCRIPRVGLRSKSCAAIITENEPGS